MRILLLCVGLAGLAFACTTRYWWTMLVILWTIDVTFQLVLVICVLLGKGTPGSSAVAVIDVVLGVLLLVYTITAIAGTNNPDVQALLMYLSGFVQAALHFVSAYERAG